MQVSEQVFWVGLSCGQVVSKSVLSGVEVWMVPYVQELQNVLRPGRSPPAALFIVGVFNGEACATILIQNQ